MLFQVNVRNLGEIRNADIRISNFTVFAGRNSTGKSYISKALYSLFNAMNVNHLDVMLNQRLASLSRLLSFMKRAFDNDDNDVNLSEYMKSLEKAHDAFQSLREVARNASVQDDVDELAAISGALPEIHDFLDIIEQSLLESKKNLEKSIEVDGAHYKILYADAIDGIASIISEMDLIKSTTAKDLIVEGIAHEIKENFLQNFQIRELTHLRRENNKPIYIDIPEIGGEICIDDPIHWRANRDGLHVMQKYSRVLYLESPIFWRIRNALDNMRIMPMRRRNAITGVPRYYYGMSYDLRQSYSGDSICPDVLEKLTGDDVLGGKVAIGESGILCFQNNKGEEYPLHLAATGIANLGMLAFLIEQNLLDKDTFLFVDEPEAHLHPAWQVEMAAALFALSQKGVKVVIATHSADILKWLEVEVNTPELQEMVALNHFAKGTVQANDVQFDEKLNAMQKDLTEPYYKLYYKGL